MGKIISNQIWRMLLKNGPATPIRSFRRFFAGIPTPRHLEPSALIQSGYLLRLTIGENLVLIPLLRN